MDGISAASEKHSPVPKAEKDTKLSIAKIAMMEKDAIHPVFKQRRRTDFLVFQDESKIITISIYRSPSILRCNLNRIDPA
ncbi:MAG: hypothetical protein COA96_15495 [SAR86 cluster bacterium]|uniref:Uncharacterized protein n=1 Tax=SAR86 cluster bacterium TaxID=2030880 RepID=A0A2A5APE1_9GAMM|nr:MAG: hypothetical protein COA96_15495 [SAR86 cluster bacterium]